MKEEDKTVRCQTTDIMHWSASALMLAQSDHVNQLNMWSQQDGIPWVVVDGFRACAHAIFTASAIVQRYDAGEIPHHIAKEVLEIAFNLPVQGCIDYLADTANDFVNNKVTVLIKRALEGLLEVPAHASDYDDLDNKLTKEFFANRGDIPEELNDLGLNLMYNGTVERQHISYELRRANRFNQHMPPSTTPLQPLTVLNWPVTAFQRFTNKTVGACLEQMKTLISNRLERQRDFIDQQPGMLKHMSDLSIISQILGVFVETHCPAAMKSHLWALLYQNYTFRIDWLDSCLKIPPGQLRTAMMMDKPRSPVDETFMDYLPDQSEELITLLRYRVYEIYQFVELEQGRSVTIQDPRVHNALVLLGQGLRGAALPSLKGRIMNAAQMYIDFPTMHLMRQRLAPHTGGKEQKMLAFSKIMTTLHSMAKALAADHPGLANGCRSYTTLGSAAWEAAAAPPLGDPAAYDRELQYTEMGALRSVGGGMATDEQRVRYKEHTDQKAAYQMLLRETITGGRLTELSEGSTWTRAIYNSHGASSNSMKVQQDVGILTPHQAEEWNNLRQMLLGDENDPEFYRVTMPRDDPSIRTSWLTLALTKKHLRSAASYFKKSAQIRLQSRWSYTSGEVLQRQYAYEEVCLGKHTELCTISSERLKRQLSMKYFELPKAAGRFLANVRATKSFKHMGCSCIDVSILLVKTQPQCFNSWAQCCLRVDTSDDDIMKNIYTLFTRSRNPI